jgi:hypothetical protein
MLRRRLYNGGSELKFLEEQVELRLPKELEVRRLAEVEQLAEELEKLAEKTTC